MITDWRGKNRKLKQIEMKTRKNKFLPVDFDILRVRMTQNGFRVLNKQKN